MTFKVGDVIKRATGTVTYTIVPKTSYEGWVSEVDPEGYYYTIDSLGKHMAIPKIIANSYYLQRQETVKQEIDKWLL